MIEWLSDNTNAGMVGLIFFFSAFCGIAYWAFNPKKKDEIEGHRYIPLEGDEQ